MKKSVSFIENVGMNRLRPEDEKMCETSERGEKLFSSDELVPFRLGVGDRLLELFGFQGISNIVFRLKADARVVRAVVDGEALPSVELLLAIRKVTGVSIDWLLTGEGPKFLPLSAEVDAKLPATLRAFPGLRTYPEASRRISR